MSNVCFRKTNATANSIDTLQIQASAFLITYFLR